MEPLGDPTDTGDTASTDIGVGASSGGRRSTNAVTATQGSGQPRSRSKLVLIGLAVVAAIALIGSLFVGGDQRARDQPDSPLPGLPEQVQPDETQPDPVAPSPSPMVQVPVVSQDLTRAGEDCRIPLDADDEDSGLAVVFTVPDGRTMRACATGGPLLRHPRAHKDETLGTVGVTEDSLGLVLSSLRGDEEWGHARTVWEPVNGRRAYRLSQDSQDLSGADRLHVIEVPGGAVMVRQRNSDFAPGIVKSVDALIASIRVEGPTASPAPLPTPGGWCASDHYVTKVPETWFAGPNCGWLNSSSESPTVLQCECLPPLWVEHVSVPFDGDFGFSRLDSDTIVDGDGDTPVRLIEGLRRDSNNMERLLRAMIIDGGMERVAVIATEFPEHVLPGHTWQDTLDAQRYVVDNLRFHSDPACGEEAGGRRIARSEDEAFVRITLGAHTRGLPSGSAVVTTGCERDGVDGRQLEVRVQARPAVIGWVGADNLRPVEVERCASGEGVFFPDRWSQRIDGDFDGDGRLDTAYARAPDRAESASAHDRLPGLAVLFANGGLATTVTGQEGVISVERFIGMGRDTIAFAYDPGLRPINQLYEVSGCDIELAFEAAPSRNETPAVHGAKRNGFCRVRAELSDSVRMWRESFDSQQGWVTVADERWGPAPSFGASDGALSSQAGAALCGPSLRSELLPVLNDPSSAPLSGDHSLSLQWLRDRQRADSTKPVGTVTFAPLGDQRYKAVGAHSTSAGELKLSGVFEVVSPTELAFTGTIESTVEWLNNGEPCVRNAGQRFVRRPRTSTFRMQDRINCDGARTDWIDIIIDPALLPS